MSHATPAKGKSSCADEPRKITPSLHGSAKRKHAVRRALASEGAGWRSIFRALTRRPKTPSGASGFTYHKPIAPVLVVFLILSAVEIPIVDLLAHPIPWLRWTFLALGAWGLLFMLGILLGFITRPHSVGPDGIRVRHGGEVDIDLPWEVIHGLSPRRRALTGAPTLSLTGIGEDQILHHVIQDFTDVDIALERPLTIRLPQGDVTVSRVHISVDDPPAFLEAVRTHIP